MKKSLIALALLFSSVQAHALVDVGVNVGAATRGSSNFLAYGGQVGFDLSTFKVGAKVFTHTLGTGSSLSLLGQIKYQVLGFHLGVDVGSVMDTTPNGIPTSTNALAYGVTTGYYFGTFFKYGIELDVLFSSAQGTMIVPMAGVKFVL